VSAVVDIHAHIIVPELLRSAAPAEVWRPDVHWDARGQVVEVGGRPTRPARREFVDIDRVLAEQDAAGIDRVVLSPWVTMLRYDADPDETVRVGRVHNEALAGLAELHPTRVCGLGTVPLPDPRLAVRELAEVMALPGLHGVEIPARVQGAYLGDERFEPFWEAAEALGAVVMIHPTQRGFEMPVFDDYFLWNTVANPLETTVTVAHMVMAGVLERHPKLKVVLAHGGGAVLALHGRLAHAHATNPQASSRLRESPAASLRRLYYDTVTHDTELLRALVDFAGADHVLLGSDYPFDMGVERPVAAVRELGLSPGEEALILGGNARALLHPGPRDAELAAGV
jgi:aminocarboxymuconate-semialdehyde decarboxylase